MLQALFAVPVLVTELGISERERSVLCERALAAYRANNSNGKPWSRATRESLAVQEPVFEALFAMVSRVAEVAFGVHVASITGRELVQFDGDFVPPHVEPSALSAIYWIDAAAEPKHACGDPRAHFSVITNGSLLNADVNEWLDDMEFSVGISHDGPGQHVRGPDPLDDPEKRAAIMDLYQRLAPKGRVSFNAMLNRSNISRAAIQQFFTELTGDPEVMIAEGAFVDAYDPGGLALSLPSSEAHAFRRSSFQEIRQGKADRVSGVRDRVASFINSIRLQRLASSLAQKCGMDSTEAIAVDLRGNVLTCQNVSAQSTAPNGESHRIGHVSSLASVELRTATHWSKRDECPKCPVLHICKGACMFLEGPLWEASCNNAYSDALPIFASGIEFLTGLVPVFIEGDIPEARKDVFGLTHTNAKGEEVTRKPFPVPVVAA